MEVEKGVSLNLVGSLMMAESHGEFSPKFKRCQHLLEFFANFDKAERFLNYKFLCGLILTSHARRINEPKERKKEIFNLKNELFLNIANNKAYRRVLGFRYLVSKNFRVERFCTDCERKNAESGTPRFRWKFCKLCSVDHKFYNVLSMHHRYDDGSATLFLSNEMMDHVRSLKPPQKSAYEEFKEEVILRNYTFNTRNLNLFDLVSVEKVSKSLLGVE